MSLLQSQIIDFPDANLKSALLSASATDPDHYIAYIEGEFPAVIDVNQNGEIENTEAQLITRLQLDNFNIESLAGLNAFINLKRLDCSGNPLETIDLESFPSLTWFECSATGINNLDLTKFPNLEHLLCNNNFLASLNVSTVPALNWLECRANQIGMLDLSENTQLSFLNCAANQLTNLDCSANEMLTYIDCGNNPIISLNITNLADLYQLNCSVMQLNALDLTGVNLTQLHCSHNLLAELDLSAQSNLTDLSCSSNFFESIDVSACAELANFSCYENPNLENLFIKNGKNQIMTFFGCPNLRYICADESEMIMIRGQIEMMGMECHANSYCSFTPGGNHYTMAGETRLDMALDGCSPADSGYPRLKFMYLNGETTSVYIAPSSGTYRIPFQAGSYTVTPQLNNPSYFAITPSSKTVTFPNDGSSVFQDFCVSPTGVNPDLEMTIIPADAARPGFDAHYTIVYHNKGNTILSGHIELFYEDNLVDFTLASPSANSAESGHLQWNYTDLLPLQTRYIYVTMNVNTPMETDPVDIGDQLSYGVIGHPLSGDIAEADNHFGLKQFVVNSLDPNDKTCLQGNTVGPEMAGEYVHYLIRFENLGTFAAQNVVVSDVIDAAQFDITTLTPIDGSHAFETRISSNNKVEFIFENIMLPFDDLSNDGYIAFKIKTLPTLVIGDTFENTASIYFDYNFPIVTNTASTDIQLLNTAGFDFDNHFTIYPNPAKDVLNINVSNDITPKSAAVYNMLGQKVIDLIGWQPDVDVSQLRSGTYLLRIETHEGSSVKVFIVD